MARQSKKKNSAVAPRKRVAAPKKLAARKKVVTRKKSATKNEAVTRKNITYRKPIGATAESLVVGLQLGLNGQGDDRELDELTRLLQAELRTLDVAAVEMVGYGSMPPGAKGIGLAAVGGLMIKVLSGAAFKNVIEAAKAWAGRNAGRSVKVVIGGNSIEVANITPEQQQKLIETFERQVALRAAE